MKNKIDSPSFRHIMGCFTTGVAIVTTHDQALGVVGLTINSLTSVSLQPPLILFCIEKKAQLHPTFRQARYFAINFLAEGQEDVSRHFADRHHHPKPTRMWAKARHGCPILSQTLGWVVCRPHAYYKAGDHTIVVGEVIDLYKSKGSKQPLTYFHGRYRALAKVTSGARK